MAAHTYWRIDITANDGDSNFLAMAEVELRASAGGVDETSNTGGTATASASDGTAPPSRAVDDDSVTRWSTPNGTLTGWWQFEFNSPVDVIEYTIQAHPISPARSPRDFTLEFSDDGVNFTVANTKVGETDWTNGETRTFGLYASTARVTQGSSEVLVSPARPDAKITQGAAEALVSPARPSAKVTQVAAEIMYPQFTPTGARVTQAAAEVMVSFTKVKLTQAVMEIMHDGVPQGRWVPFNTIL